MGSYLSSPVTDMVSCDKNCESFIYGVSSMQGWRISQEVEIIVFDFYHCFHESLLSK